ncbi:hypothetical protein S245_008622 [Arachis hypogaea]
MRILVFLDIKVCAITKSISQAFTYAEAMNRHGSGRQDTRIDLELKDISDFFLQSSFRVLSSNMYLVYLLVQNDNQTQLLGRVIFFFYLSNESLCRHSVFA